MDFISTIKRYYSSHAVLITILILLLLSFKPTNAQQYAILIGIEKYPYINNLKGPLEDVKLMNQFLLGPHRNFKKSNIKVLRNEKKKC